MEINTVAVLGGSGFVGRHLCRVLAAEGYRVRVATRDRERAKKQLILLPTVDVANVNVHDNAELFAFVRGADAVINLVGVLHQGGAGDRFEDAHVELARMVAAACRGTHARLLHMSALNADPGAPSAYLRSKGEAERIVRDSGLAWTIFRPSVIFGRGDHFLNMFATFLKVAPIMLLPCPGARFQPVHVEDVARAYERSLTDVESFGKSYDLCGPKAYTLRELVEYVAEASGRKRPIIGLSDGLSYAQATAMEIFPVKQVLRALGMLMTRDNYQSMKVDSTCGSLFPFGITPAALEAEAPAYLAPSAIRSRFQDFRERARRQG